MLQWILGYMCLSILVSLVCMRSSGIARSKGGSISSFLRNLHSFLRFSRVAVLVCIPTNSVRGFPFLHTLFSIYCLQTFGSFTPVIIVIFLGWSMIGKGNGTPLQCSCLENPSDGGAWWAAVYGVAHSRTQLKWLSSSSSSMISDLWCYSCNRYGHHKPCP